MATATKTAAGKFVRMRLSESEARLIKARRRECPSMRPQIIDGFREPRNAADLIEIIRTFAEANWANVVGSGMGYSEVQIDTADEGYVTLRAAGPEDVFADTLDDDERAALERFKSARVNASREPEFRARMEMAKRHDRGEDGHRYETVEVDARILGRAAWAKLQAEEQYQWASVGIEDGRILALKVVPPAGEPWHPWGRDDDTPLDASRSTLLSIRELLMGTVARWHDARCVELIASRNGESRINFTIGKTLVALDIRDRNYDD